MSSSACPILQLSLNLSQSPLLCGGPSDSFTATLTAQGICNPLPSLMFASRAALRSPRINTQDSLNTQKPLPIPPRQIISLVNLLESMDSDVVKEVQRVRESIKEARTLIHEHREVQAKRRAASAKRKDTELRETKGVDDDFWLNA